jgi:hypothetical protein
MSRDRTTKGTTRVKKKVRRWLKVTRDHPSGHAHARAWDRRASRRVSPRECGRRDLAEIVGNVAVSPSPTASRSVDTLLHICLETKANEKKNPFSNSLTSISIPSRLTGHPAPCESNKQKQRTDHQILQGTSFFL